MAGSHVFGAEAVILMVIPAAILLEAGRLAILSVTFSLYVLWEPVGKVLDPHFCVATLGDLMVWGGFRDLPNGSQYVAPLGRPFWTSGPLPLLWIPPFLD